MTAPPGNGTLSIPEAIPILAPNDAGSPCSASVDHGRWRPAGATFRKLVFAAPDDQRRRLVQRGRHTPGMIAASSKRVRT